MVSKVVTALKHSYIPADNSHPSFICAAVVLHILLFLFCLKDISFADYLKPYTLPDMQTIIVAQQDAKLSLKTAWQYFEHNDYKNAVNIFTQLMSFPETEGEAKYGLALSLMKLGRLNEALELANKHQDNEKFISLAKDLRLQILRKRLSAVKSDSPEAEEIAKEILSLEPEDRGAFSILVWRYLNTERHDMAYELFLKLYKTYPDDMDYTYGLALSMMKLGKLDKALELANKYQDSEKMASLAKDLRLQILRKRLSEVKSDSPEAEETAKEILSLEPENRWAFSILAWRYLNTERYDKAYEGFSKLCRTYPDDIDYVYGLALSMMKLEKYDEVLKLAEKYKDNEKTAALAKDIRLSILRNKFAALASDSSELGDAAGEILSIKPDEEGVRETLSWWYYNKKQYEKAYDEFHTLYEHSPVTKGYAFGLVNSLIKLERFDEALELAGKNKHADERLVSIEIDIYLTKANAAYQNKNYHEAEIYFEKVFAKNPEDAEIKKLLALSKYKRTIFGKAMSSIEGLPGYTWGIITHDLNRDTGTGLAALVNQGIDWVKLPGDIILDTFAEYRYQTRTKERRYFDESGKTLGLELKKPPFWLGTEYSWEEYPEQVKTAITKKAYLEWYHEWYKYIKRRANDRWLKMQALSGYTYGRITHDFDNLTGTGISGAVNQGIDWFTLPGGITLNTYAEYRFGFRTTDNLWYNLHRPALGIELQKLPFRLGMDYFWDNYTERHVTDEIWRLYFTWYYTWELKPEK